MKMTNEKRTQYTEKMSQDLPVLRKILGMSQTEFADMLGLSRSTIGNIESGRQHMTWNTFLSILTIVSKNPKTNKLEEAMESYDSDLSDFLYGMN